MPSGRPSDPTRTCDYGEPRARPSVEPGPPVDGEGAPHATRRGVGHDERRPPPSSLPKRAKRVDAPLVLALATHDGLFRATLARALVRAGCDVCSIDATEDVSGLPEAPDAAIVDFEAEAAPSIIGAFHEVFPGRAIVALCTDPETVRRGLSRMRLPAFGVIERRAPVADVIDVVKRLQEA